MKVPTVVELVHLGLAHPLPVPKGGTVTYRVSDEGHRLMGEAMRANALAAIADGTAAWTQPPSAANRWWTEIHE
jgi:hypothetical protein